MCDTGVLQADITPFTGVFLEVSAVLCNLSLLSGVTHVLTTVSVSGSGGTLSSGTFSPLLSLLHKLSEACTSLKLRTGSGGSLLFFFFALLDLVLRALDVVAALDAARVRLPTGASCAMNSSLQSMRLKQCYKPRLFVNKVEADNKHLPPPHPNP